MMPFHADTCKKFSKSLTGPPSKMRVQEQPLSSDLKSPPAQSGSSLVFLCVAPHMAYHL